MSLVGHTVPRIATPPLGPLSPSSTLGFDFENFCDQIGRPLLAWQAEVCRGLLELRGGKLRYRTGLLVVGRQNGKSELACLLALYFLYRRRARLVVGTAQTVDIAREVWLRAADIIEEAEDVLEPVKVYHANGKERLEFADGRRYLVKSASRRTRGLSPALILADEVREQTDWQAWQAISAMTLAQPEGLVFALSSAGEHDSSVVLNTLQARGRAQGPDEGGDFYYAEYSSPPGSDIDSPAAWAYGMPALGDTVTLAAVEGLRGTLPPAQFRTEVICETVARREESVIDLAAWAACADEAGTLDSARGRLGACIDVSPVVRDGPRASARRAGDLPPPGQLPHVRLPDRAHGHGASPLPRVVHLRHVGAVLDRDPRIRGPCEGQQRPVPRAVHQGTAVRPAIQDRQHPVAGMSRTHG
jgi:hypothetical protein